MTFTLPAQISWYKCISGKIDKHPVIMHLHKQQHQYSGYYYYQSTQQPVYFSGEDTSVAGKIKLYAFLPNRETDENLVFSISDKSVTGEWSNTSLKKKLNFSGSEIIQQPAWDYVFTSATSPLRAKNNDSPVASYEAAAVWPKGNSAQAQFIKQKIAAWFTEENTKEDIGKIFLKEKKRFFDNYKKEYSDVSDDDLKQYSYSYNMDQTQEVNVVFQSPKLLTLGSYFYAYTGGAHGNHGYNYVSIDLSKNRQLTIDDVLTKDGQKKLQPLLEKYFRKSYGLKSTEALSKGGLFENKIEPNDNFYVTAKGICFDYQPYEIGPYAMGEISIFIPFTELSPWLKPEFKKLL